MFLAPVDADHIPKSLNHGSGSGGERTLKTVSFNTSKYGYRWILIQVLDNDSTTYSYPNRGNVGGWGMYGMQIGYVA